MKNILKKITLILIIALCAQAPLAAMQNSPAQTNSSRTSWTSWVLGGAAAGTRWVGSKFFRSQKPPQQPLTTIDIQKSLTLAEIMDMQEITTAKGKQKPIMATDKVKLIATNDVIITPETVDYRDENENTALHIVAESVADEDVNIMAAQKLIKAGANLELKNSLGLTPFAHAIFYGESKIAKFLQLAKADINVQEEGYKNTPLHNAAATNDSVLVNFLIDAKASIDVQDCVQMTPLHRAATLKKNNLSVINSLVAAKASAAAKDTFGKMPSDYAKDPQIKEILEKAMQTARTEKFSEEKKRD